MQSLFPEDVGLRQRGLDGFVGCSLRNGAGEILGHLVAVRCRPLHLTVEDRWLIQIFSERAAAELDRIRSEAEQRQLEREVIHGEKLKSLGVLAGGIAHDFNNLLTGILGNAGIARPLITDPFARARIAQIEQAARRAEELTRQMLTYSGRGTFVVEPVSLNELVKEMAQLLESAVAKTATFDEVFQPGLSAIDADASQIRQVVMNLIMNASDALGGKAGTVSLRTGMEVILAHAGGRSGTSGASDRGVDTGLTPGDYVFVEIEDDGAGMDSAVQRRMFDPFFSTKFSGSGLGLSAVQGIVQGHRGTIRVDSRPGEGTRVRVLLPTSPQSAKVPKTNKPTPRDPDGRYRILIVDDEAMVRDVITAVLTGAGFEVLSAADGTGAIDILREDASVDLVLLDLTMPRMGGRAAAEELYRLRPHLRVVLMSGFDERAATLRFGEQNLAGFLQKPFEVETLRTLVTSLCQNGAEHP